MTGEVTLRGRVLPVGGIKQKVLAAHRAGLHKVILPKRNEADLDDLPEEVRGEMEFVLAETIDEALHHAIPALPIKTRVGAQEAARFSERARGAKSRSASAAAAITARVEVKARWARWSTLPISLSGYSAISLMRRLTNPPIALVPSTIRS